MSTMAMPIPEASTRVAESVSKRLGYRYVSICQHCRQSLIVTNEQAYEQPRPWRHRCDGGIECSNFSRVLGRAQA